MSQAITAIPADAGATSAKARTRPRSSARLITVSKGWAFALLAPFLVLLGVFQWAPIGAAIYNSFREFSLVGDQVGWAGLANYADALGSTEFQSSLLLALAFIALKLVVQLIVGLSAAFLVLRNNGFTALVRSAVFLPTATAIVAAALMFSFLFDREIGLVDALLDAAGLPRIAWLFEPAAARFVMVALSIWRDTGFVMLIFLAGLQAVPATLLDAARIDGASWWQEIRYITLPLLVRSLQFAAVFTTLACMRFIAPIDVMTQGGPRQATNLASFHIYQQAFSYFAWGTTSAMSVILLSILVILTIFLMLLLKAKWEY